jgi:transcriptional regulator with XRE-family HTH domain
MTIHNQASNKKAKENKLRFVLQKLIKDAGLNEKKLAEALGMPPTTLNQLVNAEVLSPRVETLLPIAKYFNISIEQLIAEQPLKGQLAKTEKSELLAHEWKPDLFVKCIELISDISNKKKLKLTAGKALELLKEIYMYSLKEKGTDIDPKFTEWLIDRSFNKLP